MTVLMQIAQASWQTISVIVGLFTAKRWKRREHLPLPLMKP
jgi:hypothetical protein